MLADINMADLTRADVPAGLAQAACDQLCGAALAKYSIEQAQSSLKAAGIASDSGEYNAPNVLASSQARSV